MSETELSKDGIPALEPLSLNISDIQVECYIWKIPGAHRNRGGYIKFIGVYGYGSSGRDDATFIEWRLKEFLEFAYVDGLVVDLRELNYTWGNNLNLPTYELDNGTVCVVIPSEEEDAEVYKGYTGILDKTELRTDLATAFWDVTKGVKRQKG